MRNILTAAVALLCSHFCDAQTGTISGKVTDSSGKHPLALATITIFKARDTVLVTYRLSNDIGEFKIPGLPVNVPLRLLATYSGYEAYRKEFTFTVDKPILGLGLLKLVNTSKHLEEVIVIAERPPVIFKKDTIEFNASAFKTLPNALVEDLLKRMPGMQMDADGNITYNGRPVNRILVDGKRFFGDDTKMVTRNLPSSFIDKVQVMDDKEEIAQNNDGDMSKIGKIINLTLKKDVKKGWFGKLYGGGGTDNRFELGGIGNIFRDTLQLSLVGFSNNVNRTAFSVKEITSIGGFERSGINSMSVSSTGGVAINGLNFGGFRPGISTTGGAGINLNHAPTKNLSFYGQYFFGHLLNNVVSEYNAMSFIGDTIINTHSSSQGKSTNLTHNVAIGGNWKPDSLTNASFRVAYNSSDYDSESPSVILIDNNKLGALSNASGKLLSNNFNDNISMNSSYTRRSRKKRARNLSINQFFSHSSSPGYSTTESLNQFFYPAAYNQTFNQLRSTKSPSTLLSVNATYSDTYLKKLTLRLTQRIEYAKQEHDIFTYGKTLATNKYDSLNYALSNVLNREQFTWVNSASLGYTIKKLTVTATANWQQLWINNRFGVNGAYNTRQYYSHVLPSLNIYWKRYSVNISQSLSAPYIGSLSPVPDNSNPYNVVYGNPDLLPVKRTNLNLSGTSANVKSNMNVNVFMAATREENATIPSVTVAGSGVRTSRPINVSGATNIFGSVRLTKQYKTRQKFFLTLEVSSNFSADKRPIYFNGVEGTASSLSLYPVLGLSFNWQDVVEFNPRYTPVYTRTSYSNRQFAELDIATQNLYMELLVRVPKKMIWESYITYRFNSQVAPGLPKENVYWNTSVSLLMLKDDRGQIKFSVYDLLNRYNSYFRYISANTITDSRTNVLQRYFALSFIYNVRPSGANKQKIGGRQNLFLF